MARPKITEYYSEKKDKSCRNITLKKLPDGVIKKGKKGRLRVRNSRSLYVKRIAPLLPFALVFCFYFRRNLHEMALLPYGFVSHGRFSVLVVPAAEHRAAQE